MALKDLLVYVDQTDSALARLQLAVDLASRHGSRVTALYVREWNRAQLDWRKSAELGLVSMRGLHDLTNISRRRCRPAPTACKPRSKR
jgi:nucleotide-binding universal stress UspA family protein